MQEITKIPFFPFDLTGSTRRVLFFYRLFFRSNPSVVISVPERQAGEKYAQVTAAVRSLADNFHLRVIVDGSPNSIPPELINTKREIMFYVDFMDKDVIERIPEWKELIDFLKSHKLDQGVYDVLGGSPSDYIMLRNVFEFTTGTSEEKIKSIKDHIEFVLIDALYNKIDESSPNTKEIIALSIQIGKLPIPIQELKDKKLLLDYPNKVFRKVTKDNRITIEPATPAIGLIIKHNFMNVNDVAKFTATLFPTAA